MSKWKRTTLGEVVSESNGLIQTGPFGSQLHASDYVENGVPCIMPSNMKENRVNLTGIARISDKDAQRLSQHLVKSGDIIYSRRGDITQKALIGDAENGFFCGTGCILIRPGSNVDSRFLTYFLSTKESKEWLINHAVGITMPNLNTKILSKFPLRLPTKDSQKKIAAVLSSIDQKIEINNRINAELEAMVKTLYDYWFVQFDFPDENGKPYKSSGGKMVYSKELKREIPAGWEATVLNYFCSIIRGVTYSKENLKTKDSEKSVGILRATNISGNKLDINDLVYIDDSLVDKQQYMNQGDILIVMSSGSKDHIGKNGIYYFKHKVAFGAFCSKLLLKGNFSSYINNFLRSGAFKAHIANSCLGTNINNITNQQIMGCILVKPTQSILAEFEKRISGFYKKVAISTQENQRLVELRDWLLPMLMNGQVHVSNAASVFLP